MPQLRFLSPIPLSLVSRGISGCQGCSYRACTERRWALGRCCSCTFYCVLHLVPYQGPCVHLMLRWMSLVACHLEWRMAHSSGFQSRSSSGAWLSMDPVLLLDKEVFDRLVGVSVKACPCIFFPLMLYFPTFCSLQHCQALVYFYLCCLEFFPSHLYFLPTMFSQLSNFPHNSFNFLLSPEPGVGLMVSSLFSVFFRP